MSNTFWNRREFVSASAGAALAVTAPQRWNRGGRPSRSVVDPIGPMVLRDARVKALALSALDEAHSAGAGYADVRLTYTTTRFCSGAGAPSETIELGLSVRALVNGYWGWAARPDLTEDAGPWVGREAVLLAKANAATGLPRHVELGTIPQVQNGIWTTPLQIDPFEVALQEIYEWLVGVDGYIHDLAAARGGREASFVKSSVVFEKQERVFASTEGSYLTQTVYVTRPDLLMNYRNVSQALLQNGGVQEGWEYLFHSPIEALIRQAMDRIDDEIAHPLPAKPFEVGRYDLVVPATVIMNLLRETLGPATEVDRALGYKANRAGTSYLGPDPLAFLGSGVASPLVTVSAERTTPKQLATVQWDEEGVVPEPFTIVQDGVLIDYQTTREQAAWLAPWYQKRSVPIRSHGLAAADSAMDIQALSRPNLTLHPGKAELTVEDLVAGMEEGVLLEGLDVDVDFQCLNGLGFIGGAIEVRRGKRVAQLGGKMAVLFRAPELWKSVIALGGSTSQQWMGMDSFSIAAVPAVLKQQAIVDATRKA